LASVVLKNVHKIYLGTSPIKKNWWEFWSASQKKSDVHVVKNVSMEVSDGEFLVLVGPSGCGKSTILRMIAGLEEITDGEIFIDDRLVNDVSPKDRDIAMVFQNYALYPHMDVFENMAFGLRLRRFPPREIEERVREAADLLGIKALLHRKPKELSGGQRQRVAMGRAIVRRPKVYLMDEPLSNLDAKLRVQMRAELQKLHHRLGVTTIYVTHDQTEAMTLGSRIVLLNQGVIQQMDTPMALYDTPVNQYVAGFIGSPAMNFFPVTVTADGESVFMEAQGLKVRVPEGKAALMRPYMGKEVIFGIRPEDITDAAFAPDGGESGAVEAVVEVMEPMGNEVYLYLSVGSGTLTARVDPRTGAKVGSPLKVALNMKNMHAFDRETEVSITNPPPKKEEPRRGVKVEMKV
jgi:multiple sugar transport system ATP-binding protein